MSPIDNCCRIKAISSADKGLSRSIAEGFGFTGPLRLDRRFEGGGEVAVKSSTSLTATPTESSLLSSGSLLTCAREVPALFLRRLLARAIS